MALFYQVYVGSYASAAEPGIYAFAFDPASGELSAQWSTGGIFHPSFLTIHPNKRWLFAVSEASLAADGQGGAIWSLALPESGNAPRVLNHRASGGDWPCHLALDATGRWLVITNYASGTIGVFPILADGQLGESADLVQHAGSGPNAERQEGPHPHSAIFTPDNRFLIVADLGCDQLAVYAFDSTGGRLHGHSSVSTRPGSGPRHMAFSPRGGHLYVAHELDNTVTVYEYDEVDANLSERQTVATLPAGAPENTVADIHLTSQGDRLYVSNRGHDSLAVFTVASDGRLERMAVTPCGGRWPRNFALAPGDSFLLVANQYSDEVAVLPLRAETHAPGEPLTRVRVPGASCVQFLTRSFP
jgi:6-phosphogluconolactonase